jgi:hypothetical protein
MKRRPHIFTIAFIALSLIAPSLRAQDGLAGALALIGRAGGPLDELCSWHFAAADFDNDHKLDGAVLLNAGLFQGRQRFRIEFHDSSHENGELLFATNETSLALRALDVNQDGWTDIVVEQPLTHKRLKVWLNDGHGTFLPARVKDFQAAEGERAPGFESPAPGQHAPALFTHAKRGHKLMFKRAVLLSRCHFCASPYVRQFDSVVQQDAFGPNASRAPPSA